ncbi:MAG: ATP-dependent zinc metalloprotease FtsH [Planctomycetaceae bacterium]|nr:ATP-dependent zinc metalloprotease FtsH [Planctomycetaceae bacterium]
MSESQGKPPQKNSGPNRTPGKNASGGNGLWYLLVFGVIGVLIFSTMSQQRSGERMSLTEFRRQVREDILHPGVVHELVIGPTQMTWQDKPAEDVRKGATAKRHYVGLWGIGDTAINDLLVLLEDKGIEASGAETPSAWTEALPMLFLSAVMIGLLIFLLRRLGGTGSAMSFGRSRGRLYAQDDVNVTFDDVAGIDEAVEELKEIVEFLKTPQKYQSLGGRIPRGVLLVGPPGTGKTMLAKAVAGEAGVPFFGLSGSDFVEMYVGVGAARVRDMFQQALQRSPAIIFIDELDALGKVRGSGAPGGHDEREQTLNALLVEMDGFSTDQSVIVMGATNRPETLDPALMRPGRFDRHVLVDRPDIKGRAAILKVHSQKIKMSDDVDIPRLARLTPGFVGADLANLVNEAALLSARRGDKRVTMKSFEDGVERVMAGLEKTSRIILDEVKRRVACHECGHALVAVSLPHTDPVHKISIIPRGMGALGYMLQLPEDERELLTQSELQSRIAVLLGGIAAEQIVYNETSTGAQNDLQRATDLSRRMVTEFGMSPRLGRMFYSESQSSPFLAGSGAMVRESIHSEETLREIDLEVKRLVDEAYRSACEALTSQRETLDHLARELFEQETMTAEQMHAIIDRHHDGPKIVPGTSVEKTGSGAAGAAAADEDDADNDNGEGYGT